MNRVLILGIDGYIGYALALSLLKKGYHVAGVDNFSRRDLVRSIGSNSLTPIAPIHERDSYLRSFPTFMDSIARADLTDYYILHNILKEFNPDTIVHLAEQPSAPWSMKGAREAMETQENNVLGTLSLLWCMREVCPDAHLIKLGTMGEYGTPNCDIPEGVIPGNCIKKDCIGHEMDSYAPNQQMEDPICPMSGLLFPRTPGSFYHLSKVHDTFNVKFACNTWGLRSTDIMQGVVFGVATDASSYSIELTRFDYDEYFGTAINRFCVQALVDHPLTVYGSGTQKRGFLPLKDSIQCLTIAIDNPPDLGEYRTFNQYESVYSILSLAEMVQAAASSLKFNTTIEHLPNPRTEAENHYYNPTNQSLLSLGYSPSADIYDDIIALLFHLDPYRDRCIKTVIRPKTRWR